jgi:hypothetical protein
MGDAELAELNLEPATNHGLLMEDEFIWAEAYEFQDALGWSDDDLRLFVSGPSGDAIDAHVPKGMTEWEFGEATDEANAAEERRYRELGREASELRRREQEGGTWEFDRAFQLAEARHSSLPRTIAPKTYSVCVWRHTAGRTRRARRTVRLAAHGPPGRPRPSSGDDDPHHDDVVPREVAA